MWWATLDPVETKRIQVTGNYYIDRNQAWKRLWSMPHRIVHYREPFEGEDQRGKVWWATSTSKV